jgi:hypothetical protein
MNIKTKFVKYISVFIFETLTGTVSHRCFGVNQMLGFPEGSCLLMNMPVGILDKALLFDIRLFPADINAGLELNNHISNDGIHPNSEGYLKIAETWLSVLLPSLEVYRVSLE